MYTSNLCIFVIVCVCVCACMYMRRICSTTYFDQLIMVHVDVLFMYLIIVCLPIANIIVCERNKDETKLLIGCEDGTLVSQLFSIT